MSKLRIGVLVVVGLVVLVVGGTLLYTKVINDPADKPTLDVATGSGSGGGDDAPIEGTWKPTSKSVLQYRVKEVLFGQSTEAVGTTNKVTGSMSIDGTTVSGADLTVDMTSFKSDQSPRDGQFRGRIMQTDRFPTATFKLTKPIDLGSVPADGTEVKVAATGDLTLKDTTKSVSLDMTAARNGSVIQTLAETDIRFADWGIDNPSFGPAKTEDHGLMVMKVVFEKA
jgi:polyisoprenoid-binding protein YceI